MNIKKISTALISGLFGLLIVASPVFAHVLVKPSEVGIGSFQTFTIGVPVEKDNPTVSVRLLIPEGLGEVTPTVKPGWKIEIKDNQISWSGGIIPVDQRDEFSFSAQVPVKETTLKWKAYQTYKDGSVVAWDQEVGMSTPFSTTEVINDLKPKQEPIPGAFSGSEKMALLLSIAALALSATTFARGNRK